MAISRFRINETKYLIATYLSTFLLYEENIIHIYIYAKDLVTELTSLYAQSARRFRGEKGLNYRVSSML